MTFPPLLPPPRSLSSAHVSFRYCRYRSWCFQVPRLIFSFRPFHFSAPLPLEPWGFFRASPLLWVVKIRATHPCNPVFDVSTLSLIFFFLYSTVPINFYSGETLLFQASDILPLIHFTASIQSYGFEDISNRPVLPVGLLFFCVRPFAVLLPPVFFHRPFLRQMFAPILEKLFWTFPPE